MISRVSFRLSLKEFRLQQITVIVESVPAYDWVSALPATRKIRDNRSTKPVFVCLLFHVINHTIGQALHALHQVGVCGAYAGHTSGRASSEPGPVEGNSLISRLQNHDKIRTRNARFFPVDSDEMFWKLRSQSLRSPSLSPPKILQYHRSVRGKGGSPVL